MPQNRVQHEFHVLQIHPQRFGAETGAHHRFAKHLPMNLIQSEWLSLPFAVPARNVVSVSNLCGLDFNPRSQKVAQAKSHPTLENLMRRFCRS